MQRHLLARYVQFQSLKDVLKICAKLFSIHVFSLNLLKIESTQEFQSFQRPISLCGSKNAITTPISGSTSYRKLKILKTSLTLLEIFLTTDDEMLVELNKIRESLERLRRLNHQKAYGTNSKISCQNTRFWA